MNKSTIASMSSKKFERSYSLRSSVAYYVKMKPRNQTKHFEKENSLPKFTNTQKYKRCHSKICPVVKKVRVRKTTVSHAWRKNTGAPNHNF